MKPMLILLAIASVLVAFWIGWACHSLAIISVFGGKVAGSTLANAAAWGDAFGGFNALVSALGFAAVLATLWLQSAALKDQAADLHRQRFEGTFFELMRLMREVRGEVSFRHSEEYREAKHRDSGSKSQILPPLAQSTGYRAIRSAVIELRYWLAPGRGSINKGREVISTVYEKYIRKNSEATLCPYFRIIYTILHRIRYDNVLSQYEKASYGNLLRSQLTSDEIALVAINALSPFAKDLEDLIEEFRLLKYMPASSLQRRLKKVFNASAFESRD